MSGPWHVRRNASDRAPASSEATRVPTGVPPSQERSRAPSLVPASGEAPSASEPLGVAMQRRLSCHDYEGAFTLARAILADGIDDPAAAECVRTCRAAFEELDDFALASGARVAVRIGSSESMESLPLEPVHAFVLSRIDDVSTVETVIDMTALPRRVGLQVLFALEKWRLITLV
jgi:hypothetical protein